MKRFVCIHGHFYQPPRENPGLDHVERQDTAAPDHDWNERITRECYAPNAAARILDEEGRIARIVNNYARISFNFGPTLLSWMERHEPVVYERILAADRDSRLRFSGHGSALAQVYNHAIMPLCNARDRRTQVIWGIRDFEHRFGRRPEGMWLAETAVDTPTLEELAGHGIRFTVLAPRQAKRVRTAAGEWLDVARGLDPRRPYVTRLPSGQTIALFFYDGPISQAIAFEHLLASGAGFAARLLGGFTGGDEPELVHVATDGETYGHHHRFGEMALAHALELLEARSDVELTNYGEFLERFHPTTEVEIQENSSWSCAHGIERWRADCGCRTGGGAGWTWQWRGPLRDALTGLRDEVAQRYERSLAPLLTDPWLARDDYVEVVLDRSANAVERFFARNQARSLSAEERVTTLELLEQQRHAMNMFTSCGWFFDDIAGIEAVQVLAYADRVLQVDERRGGGGLLDHFIARLAEARCNRAGLADGAAVYRRLVQPLRVDQARVAAHAMSRAVFEPDDDADAVYCYDIRYLARVRDERGRTTLSAARMEIRSRLTGAASAFHAVVAHFGDHSLTVGVAADAGAAAHERILAEVREPFRRGDVATVVRALDVAFAGQLHSMRALFRDDQRRIVYRALAARMHEVEDVYRRLFTDFSPLAHVLADLGVPLPDVFVPAARFVINDTLRRELSRPAPDVAVLADLLGEAEQHGVELREQELAHALRSAIETEAKTFNEFPHQVDSLGRLVRLAMAARALPFAVDLWEVQNLCWSMNQSLLREVRARAEAGDTASIAWLQEFTTWSRLLGVRPG